MATLVGRRSVRGANRFFGNARIATLERTALVSAMVGDVGGYIWGVEECAGIWGALLGRACRRGVGPPRARAGWRMRIRRVCGVRSTPAGESDL